MKKIWISGTCTMAMLVALFGFSGSTRAQDADPLPIPSAPVATPIPGAHEMPDPNLVYKVVFDLAKPAPKIDEINPGLISISRYVNTLARFGVPADHRKIVVVFHGADIFLNNEAFKARHDGHANPNIALIESMKQAGVDFRVCGQELVALKMDPKTVLPQVQLDLWAGTTLTTLQLQGYVRVPGN